MAGCDEVIAGLHHEAVVVDMIQGGAGTSTNMNANEVIANLALRHLSQSTNDVYPTTMRLAVLGQCAPLEPTRTLPCQSGAPRERDNVRAVSRKNPVLRRVYAFGFSLGEMMVMAPASSPW